MSSGSENLTFENNFIIEYKFINSQTILRRVVGCVLFNISLSSFLKNTLGLKDFTKIGRMLKVLQA